MTTDRGSEADRVNQAVLQFESWTGRTAPRDVVREVVVHGAGR